MVCGMHLCENKRPANEASEYLVKVKPAFENVVSKQEIYSDLIVDEKLFEQDLGEQWIDSCQNFFLKTDIEAKCYLETVLGKGNENPDENK